jgi:hypothetical protein
MRLKKKQLKLFREAATSEENDRIITRNIFGKTFNISHIRTEGVGLALCAQTNCFSSSQAVKNVSLGMGFVEYRSVSAREARRILLVMNSHSHAALFERRLALLSFNIQARDGTGHSWCMVFDPIADCWRILQSFQSIGHLRWALLPCSVEHFVSALDQVPTCCDSLWSLLGVAPYMRGFVAHSIEVSSSVTLSSRLWLCATSCLKRNVDTLPWVSLIFLLNLIACICWMRVLRE